MIPDRRRSACAAAPPFPLPRRCPHCIAETSPVAQQAPQSPRARPVVLVILDGFGSREAAPDNAISIAEMPNWTRLLQTSPHTTIDASELHVGLPAGQMGNSEVGHLNIGAGRVIYQDFTRIDHAIETGEFERNPVLAAALATAKRKRFGTARAGAALPRRRAQPRAADRRARGDGVGRGRDPDPRPCVPRRPRHAAAQRGRLARIHGRRVRQSPRRARRFDRRPLLRDGSRPALGSRCRRLRTPGRRSRAFHRPDRAAGARRGLRPRRERRIREGDGNSG